RFALSLPFLNESPNFVHGMHKPSIRIDFESCRYKCIESFPVSIEICAPILEQDIREEVHAAFRRNICIQLPHRTRSEITWVGKCRESLTFSFLIHFLEGRRRHEQFAAYLKIRGNPGLLQFLFGDR